ncbi:MAG: ion transporter [Cyclobacteriaceae bacterium]|nr:ion transporter [Cyclobacteriaceae bacterium]
MALKKSVFNIIDENRVESRVGRSFNLFIISLILLNTLAIFLESFESIEAKYSKELYVFEVVSVVIFSIEYLLRLWTAQLKYPGKSKWGALVRYLFSFSAIVDLLAILPFYMPLIIPIDMRFIRVLRILRIARVLKLSRYAESIRLIRVVFLEKRSELGVILLFTTILLIIASTLMYHLEHEVQPQAFPNIAEAMWWAVVTLTTVGYGDVVPVTALGKVISSVIAFMGIGLVALPTGILGGAFLRKIRGEGEQEEVHQCPHCGGEL